MSLKERFDIMTCHYPPDEVLCNTHFYDNCDVLDITLQLEGWRQPFPLWFCTVVNVGGHFSDNLLRGPKLNWQDKEWNELWKSLMKDNVEVYPYIINPDRLLGCQYVNTHRKYITRSLDCNSNVKVGSPRCMISVIHYFTKSTQK